MKRFMMGWGLALVLMAGTTVPALGQGGGGDVLKAVPDKAWAVLFIRDASQLDQKLMGLSQQLSLPPMSLLQMAKMSIGLTGGFNDGGSLAVVLMPNPAIMVDPTQSMVVLLPCSDYAALTGAMQPEDAGEGVSKVMLAGQESYVAQLGPFAALGPNPSAVQAVVAAKDGAGIGNVWSAHQKQRYAEDDLTLMLNIDAVIADPGLGGMVTGLVMMQGGGPEVVEEIKQYAAFSIGLRVEKDGIRLGFYVGAKAGSELAKSYAASTPTDGSLLAGLPNDRYLLAFGLRDKPAVWQNMAEKMKASLNNPQKVAQMQADPEQIKELSEILVRMLSDTRSVSASVAALPAESDGLLAFTKVVTVSGGAADKSKQVPELMQVIGGLAPMPEVQQVLSKIEFKAGAETVAGVSVDHLVINLDQMEGVSAEDYSQLKKIVGQGGLLIRMAAVDEQHLVVTLGGGTARLEQVIATVKSGSAPLSDNAGIKAAAAMLSPKRTVEGYLALDTILKSMAAIGEAIGESADIPFPVPDVPTPLAAVAMPAGEQGVQVDVAIPMPLILAAKDTVMNYGAADEAAPANDNAAPPPTDQMD